MVLRQHVTACGAAKWYFDLIKNALVVSALWYTWRRSNDTIVLIVATCTLAMFLAYVLSYPLEIIYATRPYIRSLSPLTALFTAILAAIVVAGGSLAIGMATMAVMAALLGAPGAIK